VFRTGRKLCLDNAFRFYRGAAEFKKKAEQSANAMLANFEQADLDVSAFLGREEKSRQEIERPSFVPFH